MSSFFSFKKKRIILKILSYISTASLLFTFVILPMQPVAHADVVEFTEATNAAITVIEAYGQYNGTSLAYEVLENEQAVESAGELITGLWSQYSAQASDPITLAALGAFAIAAGAVTWYTGTDEFQQAQLNVDEYISEQLDNFWNWVTGRAGWVRDENGVLQPPENFIDYTAYSALTFVVDSVQSLNLPSFNFTRPSGLMLDTNWYPYYVASDADVFGVFCSYNGGNALGTRSPVFASTTQNAIVGNSTTHVNLVLSEVFTHNNQTVYWSSTAWSGYWNQACFPFVNETNKAYLAWSMVYGSSVQPAIEVEAPVGPVILPDTSDPDYVPQPVTIQTNIPVPSRFTDPSDPLYDPEPLPADIANALMPLGAAQAVEGTLEVVEPVPDPLPDPEPGPSPDAPVEVVTPLLPVTFPSFNFSFSGIWHYVVEWVGTLGSWFSMVFTIWSHLPYAIVVPVYASAVVVIVLGVYKRFFM